VVDMKDSEFFKRVAELAWRDEDDKKEATN
jgi:hypothetical protein